MIFWTTGASSQVQKIDCQINLKINFIFKLFDKQNCYSLYCELSRRSGSCLFYLYFSYSIYLLYHIRLESLVGLINPFF